MITKKLFPVFLFLFVSVLFFSCKKDKEEEVFQSFELEAKYENGAYQLSWTPTNISTFEEYILVYKNDPFPVNLNHQYVASARKEILVDQSINTFTWAIPPDSERICFQVFVLFEGREIESNIVELENLETDLIYFDVDEMIHYPAKDAIYCFDYSARDMRYFNYKTRATITYKNIGFDFSASTFGDNGFGEELYLVKNATDLIVLDANTLEEKYIYYSGKTITSIATNEKGWIVLAVSGSTNSIEIIERDTWEIITELNYSNGGSLHGIEFLSAENNILVETSRYNIYRYQLDDAGGYVNSFQASNPYASQSNNTNLVVSPTGNYFVNSRVGELFDSSLNGISQLKDETGVDYSYYLFDETGATLFGIPYPVTFLGSEDRVDKIDLTTGIIESQEIIYSSPQFLFFNGNKIMLVTLKSTGTIVIRPLEF